VYYRFSDAPVGWTIENVHVLHTEVSASSSGSIETLVVVPALLVALFLTLIWVLFALQRRRLVDSESTALKQLGELNERFRTPVAGHPKLKQDFAFSVNSKARFDRFDLPKFMSGSILENELWIASEIEMRLAATKQFVAYRLDREAIEYELLGSSSHPKLRQDRFVAVEKRMFNRRKLKEPIPTAHITSAARYTSPKGQNSYSRSLVWNFDQLRHGLLDAQAVRASQSTTQALRQRERSLMTDRLRMTIMRRDGSRCQMCGASAADGATLHIDHIIPVSLDGRTVAENLQTLCVACNMGKSNTFIG
jgi:hypothetical protein